MTMGRKMTVTAINPYVLHITSIDTPANNKVFVQSLYTSVLARSGDQSGIDFWTAALNNHTATKADLVERFFNSSELQQKFANSSTDAAVSLYHSLLARECDSSGLSFWSSAISSGAATVGQAAKAFLNSSEFQNLQATKTVLPTVNVLWEDAPSWDSITATQLAKLIAYTPDAGKTYPNENLEFIVRGYGPGNPTTTQPDSHVGLTGDTVQPNTAPGLYAFLKSVSDQVAQFSNNNVHWGDAGGSGSIGFQPNIAPDQVAKGYWDWKPPDGTTETSPDNTFIDYSLYLSQYLSSHGLKNFSQVVFEGQNSNDGSNAVMFGGSGVQNGKLFQYTGNAQLLKQLGVSDWHSLFQATGTSGPGGPSANWSITSGGFGSDSYLAQAYDLFGGGYTPSWDSSNAISPSTTTPAQAAIDFAQFFAGTPGPGLSQTAAVNNIKYHWNTAGSVTGTSYNPNASIMFAYGNEGNHNPQFQNTTYTGNTPATSDGYRWSANDFAAFLSGDTTTLGFQNLLTQNINKLQPSSPLTGTVSVGVWGAERALDAWIGF